MGALTKLPIELLHLIVESVPREDLHALCTVSKRFYQVTLPRLYAAFPPAFDDEGYSHLRFCQFLQSLARSPTLGLYGRRLTLSDGSLHDWDGMGLMSFLLSGRNNGLHYQVTNTTTNVLTKEWVDSICNRNGFNAMFRAQLTLMISLLPNLEELVLDQSFSGTEGYGIPWSYLCSTSVGALQKLTRARLVCESNQCYNDILCLPKLRTLCLDLGNTKLLPCVSPARFLKDIRVSQLNEELTHLYTFIAAQHALETLTLTYYGSSFDPTAFKASLYSQRSTLRSLRLHIVKRFEFASILSFEDWSLGIAIRCMEKLDLLDVNYDCLLRTINLHSTDDNREELLKSTIPATVTQLGIRWVPFRVALPEDIRARISAYQDRLPRAARYGFRTKWRLVEPTPANLESMRLDCISRCGDMTAIWFDEG